MPTESFQAASNCASLCSVPDNQQEYQHLFAHVFPALNVPLSRCHSGQSQERFHDLNKYTQVAHTYFVHMYNGTLIEYSKPCEQRPPCVHSKVVFVERWYSLRDIFDQVKKRRCFLQRSLFRSWSLLRGSSFWGFTICQKRIKGAFIPWLVHIYLE